ncbi:cytochrome P450 [Actinophytocola sp.]|uniref:cytochrome P450 n=1 Tax=Actinophytocola sp. TaxID=1872138 RepID=UPI002D6D58F6|nr:cytochrome P450 [Actinophytocola sp.]HYQ68701.1 cytochrome P450 [Actinophytocola sp.]
MTTTAADSTWRLAVAPGAVPLLGHSRQLRSDPLGFLGSLSDHGDIVVVKFGPSPVHMLTRHDYAHHLLVERAKEFRRGGPFFERSRTIMGNGLATARGAEHRRQRRLTQPAFHNNHIHTYGAAMQAEVDALVGGWQPGQRIDILQAVHDLTTRVTLRCFFSADTEDTESLEIVSEAAAALDGLIGGMYRQMTAPIAAMAKLPTKANRRYREYVERFHRAVDKIIAAQRGNEERSDVLGLLMSAKDPETGTSFTDEELHDQVITFLAAGIDTTANTIAWALGLLAAHPEVREKFHAEIDSVVGDRPACEVDVRELTYTRSVLDETLRLYPPLWTMTREAIEQVRIGGHDFPAGTQFGVSPYALQRDSRVFDEPARFDPDRRTRQPNIPRTAVIPFGAGVHKCIGDGFAIMEACIALGTIAQRWELALTEESTPLRPLTLMTLGPASVTVVAAPRTRVTS